MYINSKGDCDKAPKHVAPLSALEKRDIPSLGNYKNCKYINVSLYTLPLYACV